MKTAETIEATNEQKKKTKYARGKNPNSHTTSGNRGISDHEPIIIHRWKPGQSGNPGGRPKTDWAKLIARAVFENNSEALYKAYTKAALKGNAYAFKELADRAYGKLKERVEYDLSEYKEVSEQAIIERIKELEAKLGSNGTLELPRGNGQAPTSAPPQTPETQD